MENLNCLVSITKIKLVNTGRASRCKVCTSAIEESIHSIRSGESKKIHESIQSIRSESKKQPIKDTENQKKDQSKKGKHTRKIDVKLTQFSNYIRNLSSGFRKWIKGNRKTCRTEQYICCTYKELLDHLESQFEEGMSWENHGEWQIDHFKAQSRFDPTDEEEKFKCWHYTNLQPMWAEINNGWKDKSKPGDENRIWMGREIGWVNI